MAVKVNLLPDPNDSWRCKAAGRCLGADDKTTCYRAAAAPAQYLFTVAGDRPQCAAVAEMFFLIGHAPRRDLVWLLL